MFGRDCKDGCMNKWGWWWGWEGMKNGWCVEKGNVGSDYGDGIVNTYQAETGMWKKVAELGEGNFGGHCNSACMNK